MMGSPRYLTDSQVYKEPYLRYHHYTSDCQTVNMSEQLQQSEVLPANESAVQPVEGKLKGLKLTKEQNKTVKRKLKRSRSAPQGLATTADMPERKKPKVQRYALTLEDLPIMLHINGQRYAKVMKHQNNLVVNIREYVTDQFSGKLHPTNKGIMLPLEDWQSFKKEMKKVNTVLKQ